MTSASHLAREALSGYVQMSTLKLMLATERSEYAQQRLKQAESMLAMAEKIAELSRRVRDLESAALRPQETRGGEAT